MSTELVLVTPLILIVVAFIVLAGRVVDLRLAVESAAHQAARAASQRQDPVSAAEAASRIAGELEPRCTAPTATLVPGAWTPGGAVVVTVSCTATLADLALLPLPATLEVTASATSPIDRFIGARP